MTAPANPWRYYYITLTLRNGNRTTRKVRAISERTAIIKCLTAYNNNDVASVICPEGVPVTKENQRRELANKRRAKERKQKKAEEAIMRYDGLTPIYDKTDE